MDVDSWRTAIRSRLQDLAQRIRKLTPGMTYGAVSAATLLPVVAAANQGDFAAVGTLFGIVGGIGGNLIANQIQAWKDRSDDELAADLTEKAQADPQWREALDTLLREFEAPREIQAVLSAADRDWFVDTLRSELKQIGSSLTIDVDNSGLLVIGQRNVVAQTMTGNLIFAGDNATVVMVDRSAAELLRSLQPKGISPAELETTTKRYLEFLLTRYRYLDFRGMGMSDRVALRLPLTEMYVPLKARIEMPRGDTWGREMMLAGRKATEEEVAAMGERLSQPTPLLDLLKRFDGLVILGDPGAGKTTFLKYLALRLAMGEGEALGLAGRLPVLVPLSAYANALDHGDIGLDEFLGEYYRKQGIKLPVAALLAAALEGGHALVMLDGLDEVQDLGKRGLVVERVIRFFAHQRSQGPLLFDIDIRLVDELSKGKVSQAPQALHEAFKRKGKPITPKAKVTVESVGSSWLLDDASTTYLIRQERQTLNVYALGNKFLLTSRIVGYRDVRPVVDRLGECTLVDFDNGDIADFVQRWTHALERAVKGEGDTVRQDAERERAELLEALRRNPGVRQLASNPLLLTILALMKRQGVTLPERRVELYEKYVSTLLRHWNLARSLDGRVVHDLDVIETTRVLAPLALWMHETSPGVGLVKLEQLKCKLVEIYTARGAPAPEEAARLLLHDAHEHTGLLLERGPREYGFIHLTFQEYLAAVAIAQLGQRDVDPVVQMLAKRVDDATWHEVSLLTVGYLGIVQQRDDGASEVLVQLIRRKVGQAGLAAVLAGEAVLDTWPSGVTQRCRAIVVEELLATMDNDRDVPPRVREQAGSVLSALGDPRKGVGLKDGVPDIDWISVPSETFSIGSNILSGRERPVHRLRLPSFRISRYPITNQQYAAFVAKSGHGPPEHWRGMTPPASILN